MKAFNRYRAASILFAVAGAAFGLGTLIHWMTGGSAWETATSGLAAGSATLAAAVCQRRGRAQAQPEP